MPQIMLNYTKIHTQFELRGTPIKYCCTKESISDSFYQQNNETPEGSDTDRPLHLYDLSVMSQSQQRGGAIR